MKNNNKIFKYMFIVMFIFIFIVISAVIIKVRGDNNRTTYNLNNKYYTTNYDVDTTQIITTNKQLENYTPTYSVDEKGFRYHSCPKCGTRNYYRVKCYKCGYNFYSGK